MKRYIVVVLVFLGLLGCSSNPNNLTISAYKPKIHSTTKGSIVKKIYIKSVADLRENPYLVGSFEQKGKTYAVMSNTRIATWIYESLERALLARGYKMVQNPLKEALRVKVSISKLNVVYINKKGMDNTFGNLVLNISENRGLYKNANKIKVSRQAYNSSVPNKKEYERYIKDMLSDAVDKMIKSIVKSHEMYNL